MKNLKIEFYGTPDCEYVHYEDKNEFIEDYLDENKDEIEGDEITINGFIRSELKDRDFKNTLAGIYESLDETYTNHEGDATIPSAAVEEAFKIFITVLRNEYVVHQCSPVVSETINIRDWISKNKPEWIKEIK